MTIFCSNGKPDFFRVVIDTISLTLYKILGLTPNIVV